MRRMLHDIMVLFMMWTFELCLLFCNHFYTMFLFNLLLLFGFCYICNVDHLNLYQISEFTEMSLAWVDFLVQIMELDSIRQSSTL